MFYTWSEVPMSFPKIWKGIFHSHSRSRKLGMEFSFPFPFPKFGNGICHSHSRLFPVIPGNNNIPFPFPNVGNEI